MVINECDAKGHDPVIVMATRADERMSMLTYCERCGEFDELFGFDTEQSDQIWQLLVRSE